MISPDVPGRRVAVLGCAADTMCAAQHVQDADILVHQASAPAADSQQVCSHILCPSQRSFLGQTKRHFGPLKSSTLSLVSENSPPVSSLSTVHRYFRAAGIPDEQNLVLVRSSGSSKETSAKTQLGYSLSGRGRRTVGGAWLRNCQGVTQCDG